jgi:hypothetical protein
LFKDALEKTRTGTLSDEKKWIQAYMTERYLCYGDMPNLNADSARYQVNTNGAIHAVRSFANYFYDRLTPLKTASGGAVDKFSFLIDTDSWNSFVGSTDLGYGWMLKSSSATGQRVVTVSSCGRCGSRTKSCPESIDSDCWENVRMHISQDTV